MPASKPAKKDMSSFIDGLVTSSEEQLKQDAINFEKLQQEKANAEEISNVTEDIISAKENTPEIVEEATEVATVEESSEVTEEAVSVAPSSNDKFSLEIESVSDEFVALLDKGRAESEQNPKRAKEKLSKAEKTEKKKVTERISKKLTDIALDRVDVGDLSADEFQRLPLYSIHKKMFKQLPLSELQNLEMQLAGASATQLKGEYAELDKKLKKDKRNKKSSLVAAAIDEKIMNFINAGDKKYNSTLKMSVSQIVATSLLLFGGISILLAPGLISFLFWSVLTGVGVYSYLNYRNILKKLRNKK